MLEKQFTLVAAAGLAFLASCIFTFVFLRVNDPDKVSLMTLCLWTGFCLCPLLLGIGFWMAADAWIGFFCALWGILLGACVAALMGQSNIWLIAAVVWTLLWLVPVVVSFLAGGLIGWAFQNRRRKQL